MQNICNYVRALKKITRDCRNYLILFFNDAQYASVILTL